MDGWPNKNVRYVPLALGPGNKRKLKGPRKIVGESLKEVRKRIIQWWKIQPHWHLWSYGKQKGYLNELRGLAEEIARQNVEGTNLLPGGYDNILEKTDELFYFILFYFFIFIFNLHQVF